VRLRVRGSLLAQAIELEGARPRALFLGEVREIAPGPAAPGIGIPQSPPLALRELAQVESGDGFERLSLQRELARATRLERHLLRDHQLMRLVVELDGKVERGLERGARFLLVPWPGCEGARLLDPRRERRFALIGALERLDGRPEELLRLLLALELLLAQLRLVDGAQREMVARVVGSQLDRGQHGSESLLGVGNGQLELRSLAVDPGIVGGQLQGSLDDLVGALEIGAENQLELAEQRVDPLRVEPLGLPIEDGASNWRTPARSATRD
jgi:hypothetical protein